MKSIFLFLYLLTINICILSAEQQTDAPTQREIENSLIMLPLALKDLGLPGRLANSITDRYRWYLQPHIRIDSWEIYYQSALEAQLMMDNEQFKKIDQLLQKTAGSIATYKKSKRNELLLAYQK